MSNKAILLLNTAANPIVDEFSSYAWLDAFSTVSLIVSKPKASPYFLVGKSRYSSSEVRICIQI